MPSVQQADLGNALRAAGAASQRGDGVANTGPLPVPGDEGGDRNVAGMSADAHDPEAAATETAQAPPFEAQREILAGGGPGLPGSGPKVFERFLAGGFRGLFRGRARKPEPARRDLA